MGGHTTVEQSHPIGHRATIHTPAKPTVDDRSVRLRLPDGSHIMKLVLKILTWLVFAAGLMAGCVAFWYVNTKLPQRDGVFRLEGLVSPVSVRYDDRGIPHIKAANEPDLYRALGYVHAQDRWFQMEIVRRLANGELAEILGPQWVQSDRLFRTLGLASHAADVVAHLDPTHPAVAAQLAYLDGVNQFQSTHPAPMEFDGLGIPKRPFTLQDTWAVWGYLAYSASEAFKTDPVMTFIRDELGPRYLDIFDLEWNPQGVLSQAPSDRRPDWGALTQLAKAAPHGLMGIPLFEGSNAWAVSGRRTSSGFPLLAGDPHTEFSVPAVWYEAHLQAPGLNVYGRFHPLIGSALLGHNERFGWSLTMFKNDDIDLIVEKVNPDQPNQVWFDGQWVDLQSSEEYIKVRGGPPVRLVRQWSPHGPIVTSAFQKTLGGAPVAIWWAFLETPNPLLDAFYQLNRADTLAKARSAAKDIHAPGLNIVWANERGDIGWWAAARVPIRPPGVNPSFMLNGANGEAEKLGFYRFNDNPQQENPPTGYVLSANHQPTPTSGLPVPGYYSPPNRAQAIKDQLDNDSVQWNALNTQSLQLSTQTDYFWRVLDPLIPDLDAVVTDPMERSVLNSLTAWNGEYTTLNIPPTVFTQLVYELARAAMADELGKDQFELLLGTHALDAAIPQLADLEDSPWWDDITTSAVETREDTVAVAWANTMVHLKATLGESPNDWGWGHAHTLTHRHPLSASVPSWTRWLLDVGPFEVPGGREVINNFGCALGPAPWPVCFGPSTRIIIDFTDATQARGINPIGQSGVPFDFHHSDQADAFAVGGYMPQYLSEQEVVANARSTLILTP